MEYFPSGVLCSFVAYYSCSFLAHPVVQKPVSNCPIRLPLNVQDVKECAICTQLAAVSSHDY